jgi:glutathione synthase
MEDIVAAAVTYAASHGIVVSKKGAGKTGALLSHAPMTALPSPVDASCFEYARRLTCPLNALIYAIASDKDYLRAALAETAAADADFTGRLMRLLDVAPPPRTGVEMGIYRFDYFLHTNAPDAAAAGAPVSLRMVEMNCIAASFACLGSLTAGMHRYLAGHPVAADQKIDESCLPENDAMGGLAHGLASAHATFLRRFGPSVLTDDVTRAVMVVQPGEHNVFDQELLRSTLWEKHGVDMVRMSLAEIHAYASVVEDGENAKLVVRCPSRVPFTASVVYYRAGYGPGDYPSEDEWSARATIESSVAVKCPSAAVQLVGTKKIQQVLDMPGEVERFVNDPNDANLIRACFARQYSLAPGVEGDKAAKLALDRPEEYVLKPQREGGGNNLYSNEMKAALQNMSVPQRAAFVLMERLRPVKVQNVLVRDGAWQEAEIVSEFGVYGVHVTCDGGHVENAVGGTLLRSKLATQDDGGVAAGVAVLDSPRLTTTQ